MPASHLASNHCIAVPQILVEMAIERQQELPALIYEARPVGRPYQRGHWGRRSAAAADAAQAGSPSQTMALLDEAGVVLWAGIELR